MNTSCNFIYSTVSICFVPKEKVCLVFATVAVTGFLYGSRRL